MRTIKIDAQPNVGEIVVLATGRFVRVISKTKTTVMATEAKEESPPKKVDQGKEKKHKYPAFSYRVKEVETGQEWDLVHAAAKVTGRDSYGFCGASVVTEDEMRAEMQRRSRNSIPDRNSYAA